MPITWTADFDNVGARLMKAAEHDSKLNVLWAITIRETVTPNGTRYNWSASSPEFMHSDVGVAGSLSAAKQAAVAALRAAGVSIED